MESAGGAERSHAARTYQISGREDSEVSEKDDLRVMVAPYECMSGCLCRIWVKEEGGQVQGEGRGGVLCSG